jgi:hypothetical protein
MVNKHLDTNHIDYIIPPDDDEKKKEYKQFISHECHIRGIPLQGGQIEDWLFALRTCIVMESRISFLLTVREWYNCGRTMVLLVEVVELVIPCVLHLENRGNEKIITCILCYGFNPFMGSSSKSDASAHTFIHGMQDVIQRHAHPNGS